LPRVKPHWLYTLRHQRIQRERWNWASRYPTSSSSTKTRSAPASDSRCRPGSRTSGDCWPSSKTRKAHVVASLGRESCESRPGRIACGTNHHLVVPRAPGFSRFGSYPSSGGWVGDRQVGPGLEHRETRGTGLVELQFGRWQFSCRQPTYAALAARLRLKTTYLSDAYKIPARSSQWQQSTAPTASASDHMRSSASR